MALRLDKLNRVWDGIKSGKLKHNQGMYFCGQAACVAGWIIVHEAMEKGLDPEGYEDVEGFRYSAEVDNLFDFQGSSFNIAKDIVGLSYLEAKLIFHADAEPEFQQVVIDALNAGQRFEQDAGDEDEICGYNHYLQAADLI